MKRKRARTVYFVTDSHAPEENGVTIPLAQLLKACESKYETKIVEVSHSRARIFLRPDLPPLLGKRRLQQTLPDHTDTVVVGYLGTTAHLFSGLRRSKTFCVVQDSMALSTSLNPRLNSGRLKKVLPAYTKWLAACEKRHYSPLDGIQVTTPTEQEYLRTIGTKCPIWVNRNGVDTDHKHGSLHKRFDIVVLGDFRSKRNLSSAQRALSTLEKMPRRKTQKPSALIIGWNADSVPCWNLENLEIVSREGVESVFPHIAEAKVCVSLDPHSTGIKNSVLSAMSCGVPCFVSSEVATAFSPEDQSSFLVASSDPNESANQLGSLLVNDRLLSHLGVLAKNASERYSWSRYREQFLEMLESTR